MVQSEQLLNEVKGFCERNLGNRLSVDLCNVLMGIIQAFLTELARQQTTRTDLRQVLPPETQQGN